MPSTRKNIPHKYHKKYPPWKLSKVTKKTSYKKLINNFQKMLKYEFNDPETEHMVQDIIYEKLITDIVNKKLKTHDQILERTKEIYNLVLKPSESRSRWFA